LTCVLSSILVDTVGSVPWEWPYQFRPSRSEVRNALSLVSCRPSRRCPIKVYLVAWKQKFVSRFGTDEHVSSRIYHISLVCF